VFKHSIIVVEDLKIGLSNKRLYNFQMIRLITFLFLVFISTFSFAQEIESGVIAIASNPIKITNAQGEVRIAKTGDKIYLNDTIQTDSQGKTQILLKDQMTISLGPNSQMVVDKFVYDPKEKSKNELSTQIQKGTFKFISGKIASDNKDAMKVSIPKATIAIRGTAVAGNIDPNGASTIILLHGAIDLQNATNSVSITKSGFGSQISSAGTIGLPVAIPQSVINSITSGVQTQGLSSNNSNLSSNSTIGLSEPFANVTYNNYTFTKNDAQNIQQIAVKNGQFAASAAFFNLFGIDVNQVDLNYAFTELTPTLQAILISLVKADGFNNRITVPWLNDLDFPNGYTKETAASAYSDAVLNTFLQTQIQSFTLDQFTTSSPTINVGGSNQPVGNIYFDVRPFSGEGYQLQINGMASAPRADVVQNVMFNFNRQTVTNNYSITNIPLTTGPYYGNTPTGFSNTSIPQQSQVAIFSQIKNLPGSNTLFYLPTGLVSDGSQLGMYGSINLNKSANLINSTNIDNAVWGLFGAALISPTGTTMVGSQQAIGVVNKN
jgi:hypothetical protein